jgi:predicted dithiol-disulfide oxidoreductase (DUF899 family)
MNLPQVVSRDEWLVAREELLVMEKELTRARDALNADRRRLPMVKIDKPYIFEGPNGKTSLLDLFEGRRQLIAHHFMWVYDEDGEPRNEGCPSCSETADNIGHLAHLHARGTTLAAVSRAPLAKIVPFRKRMGWTFPWSELAQAGMPWSAERRGDHPGLSVFLRDGDTVFHTYSTYARGLEQPGGTYYYLDLTPLGRQENWEEPAGRATGPGAPVRFHDEYDA